MSRIYNKYIDQAIRSVEPTLGQDKTNAFKRNLESKKLFKKAEGKTPVKHYYVPKDFSSFLIFF